MTFEREVFRSYFCINSPIEQWSDTMVWSRYAGYPGGLDAASKALGLPEDKAKMAEGKKLIQFFCKPFKGLRRDPSKYPERWELFKQYNRRDVEAEMEIRKIIGSRVDFPKREQTMWEIDQRINDQGILIDEQMCRSAVAMANRQKAKLIEEAVAITKLDNPNSVQQLKDWLGLDDEQTLRKKDVESLLGTVTDDQQKRVLQIRQELGKSSVKKYDAMIRSACPDGRVRGSLQFYGAGRTGRWAGRLIQPQNYRQNHIGDGSMRDLEYARKLVKEGDDDGIELLFGSVNDTLSQLTRTALIPSPGNRFVVADFNAIEARVIAWLADEKWKTQTFIDGKDIYCATASAMFGVPVEKHGINGELRQKGKIAELACIAEGELVLTDRGLVPIQDVTPDDRVWDGEAWVSHEGVIYKGERNVLTYEGLTATLDHLVYIQGQSEPVPFGFAATSGAHLLRSGLNLHPVRVGKDYLSRETMEQKLESLPSADPVSGLRSNPVDRSDFSENRKVEGMPELLTAPASAKMAAQAPLGSKGQVRKPEQPGVQKLWREEHTVQIPKCLGCWAVPDLEVWDSEQEYGDRPYRHQQGVRGGKSPFCDQEGADGEPSPYGPESVRSHLLALFGNDCQKEARARGIKRTDYSGCKGCSFLQEKELALHTKKVRVYDIRNAGRYHRFTVSGRLVHNCGYGGGVGALTAMGALDMGLTEEELPGIVDRWRDANSKIVSLWYKVGDTCLKVVKGEDNFIRLPHLKAISMPNPEALVINLPSGRDLFYIKPQIGMNRFGGDSLTYMGLNLGKWTRLETFGGKVVENLCQSIARDCLCTIIHRVAKRLGIYPITHIHDEIVLEAPEAETEETLQKVLAIMAEPISWAPGLVLKGAGYTGSFYFKD